MESKFFMDSMTIKSTAVVVVVLLKTLFDVDIADWDVETAITWIVALIGIIGIIVGRARATKSLRLTK